MAQSVSASGSGVGAGVSSGAMNTFSTLGGRLRREQRFYCAGRKKGAQERKREHENKPSIKNHF